MDRRMMICSMAATAIVTPLATFAQGEVKARIGWLAVGPIPSSMAAFRAAMQRRGYVEGQNLVLQERYAGTVEQYRQQIVDLIRLKVDVLVKHRTRQRKAQHRINNRTINLGTT
jgi:hypothetical protein